MKYEYYIYYDASNNKILTYFKQLDNGMVLCMRDFDPDTCWTEGKEYSVIEGYHTMDCSYGRINIKSVGYESLSKLNDELIIDLI